MASRSDGITQTTEPNKSDVRYVSGLTNWSPGGLQIFTVHTRTSLCPCISKEWACYNMKRWRLKRISQRKVWFSGRGAWIWRGLTVFDGLAPEQKVTASCFWMPVVAKEDTACLFVLLVSCTSRMSAYAKMGVMLTQSSSLVMATRGGQFCCFPFCLGDFVPYGMHLGVSWEAISPLCKI